MDGAYAKLYVDGVYSYQKAYSSFTFSLDFMEGKDPSLGSPLDGIIDEFRIADYGFSANEISTTFNNQSDPSTFFSIGSEEAL